MEAEVNNDETGYDESAFLVSKLEEFYYMNNSYVPVQAVESPSLWPGLTHDEIDIINANSDLFYKCSARRVVLIKWIMEEIDRIFEDKKALDIEIVYNHLSKHFGVAGFNRGNLRELLETNDHLTYNIFIGIRDRYLCKYNQVMNVKPCVEQSSDIGQNLNKELLVEALGEEIVNWCLSNYNGVIEFITVLNSYVSEYEYVQNTRERFNQLFEAINTNNKDAKIAPLVLASKINDSDNRLLIQFKEAQIGYVSELKNLLSMKIKEKDFIYIIKFLRWLNEDKKELLKKEMKCIFKKERDEEITRRRAAGNTLEEIGNAFNLTRERVRQIEKKVQDRFNKYLSKFNPHYICSAFSKNTVCVSVHEIGDLFGDLSDIFVYCINESDIPEVYWSKELKGIIVGDSTWYKKLFEYIFTMPDMFEASVLENYISNVLESTDIDVDHDLVSELILTEYTLIGSFYSKRKIGKADVYLTVLERYYFHGIKLFNAFEMMRFRNYATELFGDIKLPENDRAICARIAAITVLCDRGKYILPSRIRLDDETLDKIFQFIVNNERNVIMFLELFERFKAELLEKTSVDNRFYLQGVLKYKYSNEFYYTKDTLIKDINSEQDIKISIEEFIKEQDQVVTKDEIKEEFFGVTEAVLFSAVANNPNVFLWDFGKYYHSEKFVFDDEIKRRFKKLLDDYTAQGSVSVHKIYNDIYVLENEFLIANKIEGHIALSSMFKFLFSDDYEFSRSFIAPKGSEAITFDKVIREYLSSFDEIYISDFRNYLESIRKGNFSVSVLLDDISDEFIRVDSDLLYRKDRLNLTEDIIESIEEITLALIGGNGYLSVKKPLDLLFYSDIGVKWTPFLLVSVVKYSCKRLKVINTASDYRYLNEVIVDSILNINDYDELLRFVLKQEDKYTSFKNMEDVRKFLLDQDLIGNNVPQSLFDKGYITEEEHGGIKIV